MQAFIASPAMATPGDTVTLSWLASSAKQLSIDGGVGLVTGSSTTVLFSGAATYTLTATGLDGSTTEHVTVPEAALLTKATIGTTGGTLSSAGFSIELPNGALSATSELELLTAPAPSDIQSQAVTQAYVVRGLTDPLASTIRVTLPVTGGATGPAILVVRDDATWASSTGTPTANDRLLPVTIASGRIVADVPAGDGSTLASQATSLQAAPAAGTERAQITFWAITGHYAMLSSNGNFSITYPVSVINMTNTHVDLADDLEKAYKLLTDRGFTRGSNRDWPLCVSIEQTSNEAETSYTFPGYYLQQVFGFSAMTGNRETLATTAAHELFHVFQSYYDPRTRFFKRRGPSDQYWWDEATAVWFQEAMVADPAKYVPEDFAANPHESLIGLREGMQTATHGYGSGPLAKWLNKIGDTAALDIYKDLQKRTPVMRAISYWAEQHYSGSGLSWYDRFVTDLIGGSIYKEFDSRLLFGGGSPVLVDRANLSVKIDHGINPNWFTRSFIMPPFSARFFVFYPGGAMMEGLWDYLSLNAWSNSGGSLDSHVYIYDRAAKKLGPALWGGPDGAEYNDLVAKRNWIVFVVVNSEDATRNVNVEVATASGCVPAGTPVHMADGSQRSIETVERGDRILVWDEATNTLVPGAVEARLTHAEKDVETLCLNAGGRDLHVTDNHPLRTADGCWKPAGELRPGDRILVRDPASGNLVEERIASVVQDTSAQRVVYNLKTTHGNYLAADFLVHNKCFAAGALVDTVNGPRPIESLCVGDEVIGSRNGERVASRVTHLYLKRTALPALQGRELAPGLRVTDNHPVWTGQGYAPAGDLNLPASSITGPVYDLRTVTGNVFSGHHLLEARD